ncbi:MAG: ferritin [Candidatus Hydrogenedentes bacterium]|nr:ferritin [Candidatus Hydrogenedentota bacterium]
MISPEIQDAFNKQINRELYSAYLYSAMANHFNNVNLKGFANWMRIQTDEELAHARKMIDFVNNRNGRVIYEAVDAPPSSWESPLSVFEESYKHECFISESINEISSLAMQKKDHATHAFLEWFVTEQVEEEANADDIVQQLKLVQDAPGALFILDREMAQRTPAPAADGAA